MLKQTLIEDLAVQQLTPAPILVPLLLHIATNSDTYI